jgi:hypothetical protein
LATVENVGIEDGLMGNGVDFPTSTTGCLATGFALAETIDDPLVARLLATCCDDGAALAPSEVSAPTDPFVFRCPEKIIASFLRAS